MAATTTGFIFFNKFKKELGDGNVNLGNATTYNVELHSSGSNVSTDLQISTWTSITGTTNGVEGSASRQMANNAWSALSADPSSQFTWKSDAIIWTATSDANMTVKFAVFVMSLGAGTGLPIGFIQLVANDQVVTAGNTVTLTPNTYWFRMSG